MEPQKSCPTLCGCLAPLPSTSSHQPPRGPLSFLRLPRSLMLLWAGLGRGRKGAVAKSNSPSSGDFLLV